MKTQYNLDRFVKAQCGDYQTALSEIKKGRKRSHWMWYIFPQLKGLGRSPTSEFYGIASLEEAAAPFVTEESFEEWYASFCDALNQAVEKKG